MTDRLISAPSPFSPQAALTPGSVAVMLLLAVMWGLSIPVTKLGLQTMAPLTLTALRFGIAVPLLLALCLRQPLLPRRAWAKTAALGGLGIGVGQVAQTFGVQGATASVGTILSATIPLFIVLFAALRLKQTVTPRQKLGLLCAFLGMVLVASGEGFETGAFDRAGLIGAAWIIVSAVAISFYYVWSVELTRDYGVVAVNGWSTAFGFLSLIPWTLWEMAQAPVAFAGEAVASAAYLGIVVTAAGMFVWLHILRTVPAGIAAAVQYLQPVVGIVAAAFLFGDRLGLLFAAGVGLILGGLGLAVSKGRG